MDKLFHYTSDTKSPCCEKAVCSRWWADHCMASVSAFASCEPQLWAWFLQNSARSCRFRVLKPRDMDLSQHDNSSWVAISSPCIGMIHTSFYHPYFAIIPVSFRVWKPMSCPCLRMYTTRLLSELHVRQIICSDSAVGLPTISQAVLASLHMPQSKVGEDGSDMVRGSLPPGENVLKAWTRC